MSTQSKDYEIRDGKIIRYVPITPREALQALADNDGKPVEGFAFRNAHGDTWKPKKFFSYDGHTAEYNIEFLDGHEHCARIVEEDPRKVPEGVHELPEPWMAYVGKGCIRVIAENEGDVWGCAFEKWRPGRKGTSALSHYAIDVRTAFARKHFPEYVEAIGYVEPLSIPTEDDAITAAMVEASKQMTRDASAMDNMRIMFDAGREFERQQKDNT